MLSERSLSFRGSKKTYRHVDHTAIASLAGIMCVEQGDLINVAMETYVGKLVEEKKLSPTLARAILKPGSQA